MFAQQVQYVSSIARGFIAGYEVGMYKNTNYVNPAQCFGNETQTLIVTVFSDWNNGTFNWGNEVVNIQKILLLITDWCQYDEAVYDYLTYCYNGDSCEITNMVNTLLKKIFQVTTVANDVAQVVMEGLPQVTDTPATIEAFTNRIGADVGKLLRYATDFDPTTITLAA